MTKAKNPESIGVASQDNPEILRKIKWDILVSYNKLVEIGVYPTLRAMLRMMPYWVHEKLGARLQREMVREGLLPPPRERCTPRYKSVRSPSDHSSYLPTPEQIQEDAVKLLWEREEMRGRGEYSPQLLADQMTPAQASEWAVKRFDAAWASIRQISRWRFLAHSETLQG